MPMTFTVPMKAIIKELALEELYMPVDPEGVLISSADVNRLGVEMIGFLDYFDSTRLLVCGNTETAFLGSFSASERFVSVDRIFEQKPPAMILTRNIEPYLEIMDAAKRHKIPMLRSSETTSSLVAGLVSFLNVELAPRVTRHGVLVEVYGEGILLAGDSGVGKSETAIELIKRGHRLIADDAVEIRRVSSKTLVGAAPQNIRHFIELRGIGIINARRIFGMGAVKLTEKIDMVVQMEIWDSAKQYDRMGMDSEYTEILGNRVPILTIPVKPGRNLAVIIEVASMNNRQKKMGYNAAQELLSNLGMETSVDDGRPEIKTDWGDNF